MAEEYTIKDEYPGQPFVLPGWLHIGQGYGALMDPNGEAVVWKDDDLHGALLITRRMRVTSPSIETGNVTTCCIATATTEQGRKLLIHARFPKDLEALSAYGIDQIMKRGDIVHTIALEQRGSEELQRKYTTVVGEICSRRSLRVQVLHRRKPETLDIGRPYSVKY